MKFILGRIDKTIQWSIDEEVQNKVFLVDGWVDTIFCEISYAIFAQHLVILNSKKATM